jgi:hypothetical protein
MVGYWVGWLGTKKVLKMVEPWVENLVAQRVGMKVEWLVVKLGWMKVWLMVEKRVDE